MTGDPEQACSQSTPVRAFDAPRTLAKSVALAMLVLLPPVPEVQRLLLITAETALLDRAAALTSESHRSARPTTQEDESTRVKKFTTFPSGSRK